MHWSQLRRQQVSERPDVQAVQQLPAIASYLRVEDAVTTWLELARQDHP
ncbi:MAG: hypothetical protein ACK5QW_10810 [Cyanobacteriota bacterium]